jgi:hypothetical protein
MPSLNMADLRVWLPKLDLIRLVQCRGILINSHQWRLQALLVADIKVMVGKEVLAWLRKGMVKCLTVLERCQVAPVDTAAQIMSKVVMVVRHSALVDTRIKLAATAATKDDLDQRF